MSRYPLLNQVSFMGQIILSTVKETCHFDLILALETKQYFSHKHSMQRLLCFLFLLFPGLGRMTWRFCIAPAPPSGTPHGGQSTRSGRGGVKLGQLDKKTIFTPATAAHSPYIPYLYVHCH